MAGRRLAASPVPLLTALLAILAVPLMVVPDLHYAYSLPKVTAYRLAAGVILLAWFVSVAARPRRPFRLELPDIVLAGLVSWLVLASLASPWPVAALLGLPPRFEGVLGFVGYAVFYATGRCGRGEGPRLLVPAVAAVGGVLGLLAVLEAVGLYQPLGTGTFGFRAVATLGNPVFLGTVEAMSLPLALGLALNARDGARAALAAAVAAFATAGLVLSFSRAAWLAALVGGLLVVGWAVRERRRPGGGPRPERRPLGRRTLAVAAILAALLAVGSVALGLSAAGRAELDRVAGSFDRRAPGVESRLLLWETTLGLISERPLLGWGPDTFLAEAAGARPERLAQVEGPETYPDRPHNHWLYLAYAGGLPALLLHLTFGGVLAVRTVRLLRSPHATSDRGRAVVAVAASLLAYEIQSLAGFSLPLTTPVAAVLAGVLVALTVRPGAPRVLLGRRGPGGEWRWEPGAVLAVLLLLAALPFFAQATAQVTADVFYARAVSRPWDAPALLSRAVSLSPLDPAYAVAAAQAYERRGSPSDLTRAEQILRQAITGLPYSPDPGLALADLLRRRAADGEAQAVLQTVLRRDPYHAEALAALGTLELEAGRPQEARPLLERRVRVVDDGAGWFLLGQAREETGALVEARQAYERALALVPGWSEAEGALERLAPPASG